MTDFAATRALFDLPEGYDPEAGAPASLDPGSRAGMEEAAGEEVFRLLCSACHTTTEWKPATVDHRKFTREACTTCHDQKRPADALHRQVGNDCAVRPEDKADKIVLRAMGARDSAAARRLRRPRVSRLVSLRRFQQPPCLLAAS